jgi:FkbM family methyltransferase
MMDKSLDKKLQKFYREINEILPTVIDFDEFSISVDKSGASIYRSDEFYLLSKNKIFKQIYNKYNPKLVLDIGANIGFTTVLFSHCFKESQVYSYEPNQKIIEFIEKNCIDNNIKNVKIFNKAVGDCVNNKIHFQINNIMSVDSRVRGLKSDYELCTVEQTTIDQIMFESELDANEPVFIKIDTQGNEERVLSGASKFLTEFTTYCIVMEFAPFWLDQAGTDPVAFIKWICNDHNVCELPAGMQFYFDEIDNIQKRKLVESDLDEFVKYVKALRRNEKGWCDLMIYK